MLCKWGVSISTQNKTNRRRKKFLFSCFPTSVQPSEFKSSQIRFNSILHFILLHLNLEILRDFALLALRAFRVEHEPDRSLAAALAGLGSVCCGGDGLERVLVYFFIFRRGGRLSAVVLGFGGGTAVEGGGVSVLFFFLLLPAGEAGELLRVGFLVQGDADREEFFDGVVGADDCCAAVVRVEFEEVEEGFYHAELDLLREM